MQPEEHFAELVEAFAGSPGVVIPPDGSVRWKFGTSALKVNGKIFAMLVHSVLAVKLPAPRVVELIAAGEGQPFGTTESRPMKEWVSLAADASDSWLDLAREAYDFVSASSTAKPSRRRTSTA
jgi:hypothetical protein